MEFSQHPAPHADILDFLHQDIRLAARDLQYAMEDIQRRNLDQDMTIGKPPNVPDAQPLTLRLAPAPELGPRAREISILGPEAEQFVSVTTNGRWHSNDGRGVESEGKAKALIDLVDTPGQVILNQTVKVVGIWRSWYN